jgi:diguanylate cyclase (GGDEF)-like protein
MPTALPVAAAENAEDGSPPAGGPSPPPFAGRALPLLIVLLVLIAAALWASLGDTGTGGSDDWWQALALAVAVGVTETTALHFEFRRQAFSMSLSEAPVVVGLFFVAPIPLLAARLVGAGASFVVRRTRPVVVAFNLPLFAVEVAVAVSVFRAIESISGWTSHAVADARPLSWLAALAAVVAYDLVSAAGVLAAIFATQARLRRSEVAQLAPAVAMSAVFGTTIGLLIVVVLHAQAAATVLLAVLAAVVLLGFRAYGQLSRRHATLNEVHAFTQQVAEAPDGRELAEVLLRNAARLLNAEAATLRLLDSGPGGAPGVLRLAGDGRVEPVPPAQAGLRADDGVRPSVLFGAQSVLLPRSTSDPVRRRWLTTEGVRDALLVPLPGTSGVLGCLEVTDRLGEVATFTDNDRQLAETLAAAVAVALENTRLVEKSLHDATHDSLTGLPNRSFFLRRTEIALAGADEPTNAAVLTVDLDRFKEVNDTLGHLSGDRVLAGVADLLRAHAPAAATVARLGGDEFGVLLPEPGDVAAVVDLAGGLQRALQRPLELEGLSLEVTGSIGVAVSPYDGGDAATLLQRADAAMFAAKREDPGSVRTWDASMDTASPRRLALVGELRRALERGELRVHYQPKVSLATRDVIGMEALVRWQHPSWGLLPPDEFVPVAETTGLIVPLTSVVLRTALQDCRQWLENGARMSVAVNLSVRGLLDPELHATVRGLLESIGVPAELLTLEITESHVMSDVARVLPLLESLHELGVKLSVDDFGTGYSSLAYLRRLPVDEIKIDKSFVLGLAEDAVDASSASAIVETIVGLAGTLGLTVVAEGVEDEQSWRRLEDVGCDVAQGYVISRPMPAPQVAGWLTTWRQRTGGSAGPVSLRGRPL